MTRFDFSPLYRNTVGFDRLSSLVDSALQYNTAENTYPPYNIQALDESRYQITLAVAGFDEPELEIEVKEGVLAVSGQKAETEESAKYLYQGIAHRNFQRRFQLADHVEVVGAALDNGLLTINLKKELPEAVKPKRIDIVGKSAITNQAQAA